MQATFLGDDAQIQAVRQIIQMYQLPLSLFVADGDCSNKTLKRLAITHHQPFLFFEKDSLTLAKVSDGEVIKTTLNWQSLQKRIVTAGKNTELLLKAAKLTADMQVIDGTAGFGVDGLILASTGASVVLIEQNPLLFLMLIAEKAKMSQNPNWQKLMQRLDIRYGDSGDIIQNMDKVNLIYLDPMFPNDSYKGAVNKNMQVLHSFVAAPTLAEELALFDIVSKQCEKLIIKRPISAPDFAKKSPNQSLHNDVIRFDKYDG